MSVFKSKTILISCLTCYSVAYTYPLGYIAALIIIILPLNLPILSTLVAIAGLILKIIQLNPVAIVITIIFIIMHLYLHGIPWKNSSVVPVGSALDSKFLVFVYFTSFSFLSLSQYKPSHYLALLALYLMLFIYSFNAAVNNKLCYVVYVCSYMSIIWAMVISLANKTQLPIITNFSAWGNEPWWYYMMLSFSAWIGIVLVYQVQYEDEQIKIQKQVNTNVNNQANAQVENIMIQMQDMSNKSNNSNKTKQKDKNKQQMFLHIVNNQRLSQKQQRGSSTRNILPPIPMELAQQGDKHLILKMMKESDHQMNAKESRQFTMSANLNDQNFKSNKNNKQKEDYRSKSLSATNPIIRPRFARSLGKQQIVSAQVQSTYTHESQGQQQITNLFLLIPFTLFQPSFVQFAIYFYLIYLQKGRTPMWVFYIMFLSICCITFIEDTASLKLDILLRMCMILIVNKNFKHAVNITRVLRSVWLRSSFVFVLLVLFWFSLLTVNVFHISFILIVLIFITKNTHSTSKKDLNGQINHLPSFRHRNWKYLILLFNVFLLLRFIWLVCKIDLHINLQNNIHDILSIIGITYNYGLNWEYFNMIPLLVSGVLTIQYWTYSSLIYDQQSKQTLKFMPAYRTLILKLMQILTIVYYKIIPWASHFVVITIIIYLQFSLIADLVLIWSLFILIIHMIRPNQLSAYRTMYRMWDVFLKLVSFKIVLRYIFEFIKFPLIFSHISQFPIIKSLILYQQVLGLAIRQSNNSYLKNTFTKFQIMMILDFAIIAISFLTIQYYDVMIKYYEFQGIQRDSYQQMQMKQINNTNHQPKLHKAHSQSIQNAKQDQNQMQVHSNQSDAQIMKNSQTVNARDAVFIYQNYIDFKLTKWLQSFNDLMLVFSKLFLKIYYPFLGTFSCIYYSYATFIYFLTCVYYYFKINLKYYQIYAVKQVQLRIMRLFHLWRLRNNIRINLVQPSPIHTDHILIPQNNVPVPVVQPQQLQYLPEQLANDPVLLQIQRGETRASTQNPISLYRQLKKQLLIINYRQIFDNFINLHITLRFWILTFTMLFVVLNYTSRLLMSKQIQDFLSTQSIQQWRYMLFVTGTSVQSPIHISMYLFIIALTVIQIKCCSLAMKIGRRTTLQKQFQKNQQINKDMPDPYSLQHPTTASGLQTRQVRKFIDVAISLRLGVNKIIQRFFVILLVFVSLLQNQNPFSIVYLICAWFLNYMGAKSIQGLTWTLCTILVMQYSLIITDTTNPFLGAYKLFPNHVHHSWIVQLFNIQNKQWITYLTFANNLSQAFVMFLSLAILILYQICFYIQEYNWIQILDKMFEKINIGGIYLKLYEKISQIYQYALVYSPLFIITLCLGLYLMDFTATNMFLSILSIIFLFKSFLLQNYTNSRPFWKSYFRILQLLIVIFMAIYCILSAPMYNQYCNKVLCSPQQFRTKITKTILLLILQIGIDLISSHHFINAMATLQHTLNQTSSFYRVAISIVQNDKKIWKSFQSITRKQTIKKKLCEVRQFLNMYENDSTVRFQNKRKSQNATQSWIDTILSFMPSFIDSSLIKGPQQTRAFAKQENNKFIDWLESKNKQKLSEEKIKNINELYMDQFGQIKSLSQLKAKLDQIIAHSNFQEGQAHQSAQSQLTQSNQSVHVFRRERNNSIDMSQDDLMSQGNIRKSYIHNIMPYGDQLDIPNTIPKRPTNMSIRQQLQAQQRRDTLRSSKTVAQQLSNVNEQQKKKLLYLKIFQSVVSNWHYLTYMLMILQFIINMGILTLPFPFITFALGIVHSYQAPKSVWRLAFLSLLPPIFFKYSLQIQLFHPNKDLQFVLIGSNNTSIIVQYLLMFFIVVQCLILKIAGLYDQSTAQVQCMNIALIRNIINVDENNIDKQKQRQAFYTLLQKSKQPSYNFFEYLFSLYECKFGYDYSTLMVTIQIVILIYIFIFYDRMAVKQQLTFYKMIEYNQFTTGMVIMAFIQLGFMLLDRIMTVLQLPYKKWDVTLIMKYVIMITSLLYVHVLVLAFFPINSGYFGSNKYILVFYILHIFYFLISSLQVKVGLNKQSRGFMDRYSWYNGYIYMCYRAIPFLFQFKVFSDWTFTTTSLRLFDWIKYQQVLGYVYVAKCNSLFLRGKILGSKIQWWKKLLMGFPLLLTIILLLFGPLILFSSLNPLSSLNQITGGYLQLSLKINKTNEYPFYTNTHITDIHFLDKEPDKQLQQIIKTYELDEKSIQIIHLQPFSDQYWQISQGSYNKLIDQPQNSLYQLTIRVKFDRNQTKTTPVYVLNTYIIPSERVKQFKNTLQGRNSFKIPNFVPSFMRLDNNNGIHFLTQDQFDIVFHAQQSRTLKKKYWVINDGITFKMASDKYSKAIFGYSVMSFYISIILVVANYFRFLFQGSAYTIIMSDIPYADSILSICDGIYLARLRGDIYEQQMLFWTLIDIIRSPDLMKAITGNYLNARLETLAHANPTQQPQVNQSLINQKDRIFLKKQS